MGKLKPFTKNYGQIRAYISFYRRYSKKFNRLSSNDLKFNRQPSKRFIFNRQPSTVNRQPSTVNRKRDVTASFATLFDPYRQV